MDPHRLKDAYQKLQSLDERMTHKVRPSTEQLEAAMRDLASYTVELKEVVQELFLAIASKPAAPGS
jgi:cell division protein ZapA (FtsZ GTPase activity inhibitor)